MLNCRYTGEGGISNMAIISVKMVSGWAADAASLKSLVKSEVVQRYEIDKDGTVQLYFNQVRCSSRGADGNQIKFWISWIS